MSHGTASGPTDFSTTTISSTEAAFGLTLVVSSHWERPTPRYSGSAGCELLHRTITVTSVIAAKPILADQHRLACVATTTRIIQVSLDADTLLRMIPDCASIGNPCEQSFVE